MIVEFDRALPKVLAWSLQSLSIHFAPENASQSGCRFVGES